MKKGDLIKFNSSGKTAIVTSNPYNKPVWGASGHPEDIEIATMIEVTFTNQSPAKKKFRLSYLRRAAKVV
tara:strand:+ start:213 stop:422 length:210 start_codon:yes stop_codon:yes gene_type:complete